MPNSVVRASEITWKKPYIACYKAKWKETAAYYYLLLHQCVELTFQISASSTIEGSPKDYAF